MVVWLQAGDRDLLVDVDWISMPGHRVGLVGANGEVHRGSHGLSSSEQLHVRCKAGLLPQVAANLPS